jgi:hypothetical protein
MIEGPSPAQPKGPGGGWTPGRVRDGLRDSLDAVKRWARGADGRRDGGDPFLAQLQLAGRVFWGLLGALGLYLVVDVFILQPAPPRLALSPQAPAGAGSTSVDDAAARVRTYRENIISRNPFRLEAKQQEAQESQTAQNKLQELTATLVIVGINRGAVPEALVEDTETKRTHFVKVGDEINGIRIIGIDQEGVRVTYEGEETVLK